MWALHRFRFMLNLDRCSLQTQNNKTVMGGGGKQTKNSGD